MRRVTIRLPEDHPLCLVPAEKRGEIARYWLDIGRRLADIEAAIQQITAGSVLPKMNGQPIDPKATKTFLSKL